MKLNESAKPSLTVICTTPRAGSTFVGSILADYFLQRNGTKYLSEYFNPWDATPRNGWITSDGWKRTALEEAKSMPIKDLPRFQIDRYDALMKAPGSYLMKYFPGDLEPAYEQKLLGASRVIYLRRSNLLEQYLSYMASDASGLWFEPDGLDIDDGSLLARLDSAYVFASYLRHFNQIVDGAGPKENLTYEKIVEEKTIELSEGAIPILRHQSALTQRRPNKGNKLELFRNKTEVMDWFRAIESKFSS
jgi:LPS sulfotransferase NodH